MVFRAKEAREVLEGATHRETVSAESTETAIPLEPSRKSRKLEHPRLKTHKGRLPVPDALPADVPSPLQRPDHIPEGFCQECFIPLVDDPDPEMLFIYLHALRYTTDGLGQWETPLPRWAGKDWEGDWRGWSEEDAPRVFEDIKADRVVRLPPSQTVEQ